MKILINQTVGYWHLKTFFFSGLNTCLQSSCFSTLFSLHDSLKHNLWLLCGSWYYQRKNIVFQSTFEDLFKAILFAILFQTHFLKSDMTWCDRYLSLSTCSLIRNHFPVLNPAVKTIDISIAFAKFCWYKNIRVIETELNEYT